MTQTRKMLVTSALPYANGDIHLGHMVEHIQTDIWVRFHKMRGHECYYVCADDTHGTPVMLAAQKQGISPEELIDKVRQEHLADFQHFLINYDNYYTTHSAENRAFCEQIYLALRNNNKIAVRTIEQLYDPEKNMFLPDRFVKGECPKCHAKDQYGDNCEVCSATYRPVEMINPYSVVSGAKPILKESEHYFFCLSECSDFLTEWTQSTTTLPDGTIQPALQVQALNKMNEWLKDSQLQDWDISRDAPYFGFEIPDAPGKYFYVWLDAPIGYMASFKDLCNRTGVDFDSFFSADSTAEMYHFIGKDILYFHSLFWPATLKYAGLRTPTAIFTHGFLTIDGQKMSKSRGTFITAKSYIESGMNPEWMRYYLAAKLNSKIEDIDLNLEDFQFRVNSDLVGKYINIAARAAGFIHKRFEGKLAEQVKDMTLLNQLSDASESIALAYQNREYGKAMRDIMTLADEVNAFTDANKPWELAKQPEQETRLHEVCSILINAFKTLTVYLKPVLPDVARQAERFLNLSALNWPDALKYIDGYIQPYQHLMQRIDPDNIAKLLEINKQNAIAVTVSGNHEPIAPTIKIDDFTKLDLRVGQVENCRIVSGSTKLLQFTIDLGFEKRNIFSGIQAAYPEPEKLIGRKVVVVANLAPRKMRFGVSEGMILCASGTKETDGLFLLDVDQGATAGMKIS